MDAFLVLVLMVFVIGLVALTIGGTMFAVLAVAVDTIYGLALALRAAARGLRRWRNREKGASRSLLAPG